MTVHPRLKMLSPHRAGFCAICKQSCILRFIDRPTAMTFGSCCVDAMKFADAALDVAGKRAGMTHPETSSP